MNVTMPSFTLKIEPAKTVYSTREQLYALCVLLCWPNGLTMSDVRGAVDVNLVGTDGGNTGVSAFLLQNNPNATDLEYSAPATIPYETISFKVLGVDLEVQFDEDGVGVVCFAEQPAAEAI